MSAEYWQRRSQARMDRAQLAADEIDRRVVRAYQNAKGQIYSDIARLRKTFGKRYGLTDAQTEAFLKEPCGREGYLELLKRIEELPDGNDVKRMLQARASSGAYAFRINRLEALLDQTQATLAGMAAETEQMIEEHLFGAVKESAARAMFDIQQHAGVAWSYAGIDDRLIRRIVHEDWSGAGFSGRIWKNSAKLSETLSDVLTSGMMTGRSMKYMSEQLAERMNVPLQYARTMIHTETTHAVVQADLEAMAEAEIEHYEFNAVLDKKTSDVCQELDGKVFRREEAETGVNLPPMHPNCRSIDTAWFDDEDYDRLTRIAADPVTGEATKIPSSMKYPEWIALQREKYGNEAIDRVLTDQRRQTAQKSYQRRKARDNAAKAQHNG